MRRIGIEWGETNIRAAELLDGNVIMLKLGIDSYNAMTYVYPAIYMAYETKSAFGRVKNTILLYANDVFGNEDLGEVKSVRESENELCCRVMLESVAKQLGMRLGCSMFCEENFEFIVTIPSYWGSAKTGRIKELMVKQLGNKNITMITDVEAIIRSDILSHKDEYKELTKGKDQPIIIATVDVGAKSTNVSIVKLNNDTSGFGVEILCSTKILKLGGDLIDLELRKMCANGQSLPLSLPLIKSLKESISTSRCTREGISYSSIDAAVEKIGFLKHIKKAITDMGYEQRVVRKIFSGGTSSIKAIRTKTEQSNVGDEYFENGVIYGALMRKPIISSVRTKSSMRGDIYSTHLETKIEGRDLISSISRFFSLANSY